MLAFDYLDGAIDRTRAEWLRVLETGDLDKARTLYRSYLRLCGMQEGMANNPQ